MSTIAEIQDITKFYKGFCALDGASLKIRKNTIHGLIGPNGAGKSTLMSILAGILRPSSGKVIKANSIGLLPENLPLYNDMFVGEYLKFVNDIHGFKDDLHYLSIIEFFKIEHLLKKMIGGLSRGQRQLIGLAQAVLPRPSLLILDEPATGLDPEVIYQLREKIKILKKDCALFISTHRLHEIALMSDDISIINKGKIVLSGPQSKILKKGKKGRCSFSVEVDFWTDELTKFFLKHQFVSQIDVSKHNKKTIYPLVSVELESEKEQEFIKVLIDKNIKIISVNRTEASSLEDSYLSLIQ